jgi:hypothetical protein
MPPPSLEGVREKFRRAEQHFDLLQAEIRGFFHREHQPIGVSAGYLDAESGWHIFYGFVEEEPPLRLGVILGDFVHNARSALDHLVWQLVLLNGGTPKSGARGNRWPIANTEHEWRTAHGSDVRDVAATHVATIEQTQPYNAGDRAEDTIPSRLRFLSDVDKHQVVHPTLAVILDPAEAVSFRVTSGSGEIVRKQVRFGAPFEHRTELMRVRVEPLTPDTKVEMEGDVPVDIAFSERRLASGVAKQILDAVRVIIREFEPLFDP